MRGRNGGSHEANAPVTSQEATAPRLYQSEGWLRRIVDDQHTRLKIQADSWDAWYRKAATIVLGFKKP
jgi:hypothetical protein